MCIEEVNKSMERREERSEREVGGHMCRRVPSKPEMSLPQTSSSRSFPKSSLSQANTNNGSMGQFPSNLGNILCIAD
jgi:hypothetical protein